MGLLWLSTVPPTNAIVAQIFGVQYMSMLGGFVFLSHQIGSFLGAWLGGRLYDATGSYDLVWWIAVALGVFAALVNLPVRETPIVRARWRSRHEARPPRCCCWAAVAVVLGAVFAAYRSPHLVVDLANLCGPASDARRPRPGCTRWARLIRPGGTVLDLACGSGRHLRWLAGQGLRRHRRRPRRRGAGAAARPWPRSWWPTSKTDPGRCPGAASTPWSSPTTCGGRCCRELLAAARRRRRAALRDLCRRQADRRPAVAARLPAAARGTAGACARVCTSSPTRTARLERSGALRAAHRRRCGAAAGRRGPAARIVRLKEGS